MLVKLVLDGRYQSPIVAQLQHDLFYVHMGGLFQVPAWSLGGKKAYSSTLLGSVTGTLQNKLTKDRLTGEKGSLNMHIGGAHRNEVKTPKRLSDLEAYITILTKCYKLVEMFQDNGEGFQGSRGSKL